LLVLAPTVVLRRDLKTNEIETRLNFGSVPLSQIETRLLGFCRPSKRFLDPPQGPEGQLTYADISDTPRRQAESGGMVLVAYAGPVRPAAALRDSVLCLPTDIHS